MLGERLMNRLCGCSLVLLVMIIEPWAGATEYPVSSAAEIHALKGKLQPGDVLVMADAQWKDQNIWLHANGTAEKPIALRAKTPGEAVFVGNSSIALEGSHLI